MTMHVEHSHLSDTELRVRSLESLLIEKGLVDPVALDAIVDRYENKVGPRNGARVVARAWVDPGFKKNLLENASTAIDSLGYTSTQGVDMLVLENTPSVHNVTVCTMCSCYPWAVLGLPPAWYKSFPTARVSSRIRVACCANSGWSLPRMSRSACGTVRRNYATSCCRNGLRERTA